jgi:hypothetical protein
MTDWPFFQIFAAQGKDPQNRYWYPLGKDPYTVPKSLHHTITYFIACLMYQSSAGMINSFSFNRNVDHDKNCRPKKNITIQRLMLKAVLRIRDVYPGSWIRIFPSGIQGQTYSGSLIRIRTKVSMYF